VVTDSESGDFLFWQGNQGIARRLSLKSAANFHRAKVDSFRLPAGRGREAESQAGPQVDTASAKKHPLRTETKYPCQQLLKTEKGDQSAAFELCMFRNSKPQIK
jgi:hypothetical protein